MAISHSAATHRLRESLERFRTRPYVIDAFGADLRSLAALRIALAVIVIMDTLGRWSNITVHYTDRGVLPRAILIDGMMSWRWSLNLVNGSTGFQQLVFAATVVIALALLVGYRTRLMTVVVWALVFSIQVRNPLVLSGADSLLRVMLFWSMFLPLGARWSLDARRGGSTLGTAKATVSFATVAIFLQVAFMYWFTAILKDSPAWRSEGTALYYALGAEQITTPLGQLAFGLPHDLLRVLTFAALILEVVAPILLFCPIRTPQVRLMAALALMGFHAIIMLTMNIGIFPWTSALSMLVFFPSWFWDSVVPRIARTPFVVRLRRAWHRALAQIRRPRTLHLPQAWPLRPHLAVAMPAAAGLVPASAPGTLNAHPEPPTTSAIPASRRRTAVASASPVTNVVCAFLLAFVFFWNVATVSSLRMPAEAAPMAYGLGLYQNWAMFAPRPPASTSWYVLRGWTTDGRMVDLLQPVVQGDMAIVQPPTWEQPGNIATDLYKDKYWRKYLSAIAMNEKKTERRAFAAYTCRQWNAVHTGDLRLVRLQLVVVSAKTLDNGTHGPQRRQAIALYQCG